MTPPNEPDLPNAALPGHGELTGHGLDFVQAIGTELRAAATAGGHR
jgi:hypothetical protein